ncbi:hypothetical protein Pcinc_017398 [Petrolisthes cinctipes]|uniref:Uncharacterized protein n=1 Tax=Petrolisthes cinctipes TaxID=88211 RepID=A0AAE1KPY4_PETCI|nr:hypothetical protein Pcinc_017398 [Petrolisthes cinctipes]
MDDPRAIEFKSLLDQLFESEERSMIVDFLPLLRTLLPEKLIKWIIKMDVIDTTRDKFLLYYKDVYRLSAKPPGVWALYWYPFTHYIITRIFRSRSSKRSAVGDFSHVDELEE